MPVIPKSVAPQVPSIKSLCSQLGYADNKPPHRAHDLTNSTKRFRNEYVSPSGMKGKDIIRFEKESGNVKLKQMAEIFLEVGNGDLHWPIRNTGDLEYPRDRERLVDLLHLLFYRQNCSAFSKSRSANSQKLRELDDESLYGVSSPNRKLRELDDGSLSDISSTSSEPPTDFINPHNLRNIVSDTDAFGTETKPTNRFRAPGMDLVNDSETSPVRKKVLVRKMNMSGYSNLQNEGTSTTIVPASHSVGDLPSAQIEKETQHQSSESNVHIDAAVAMEKSPNPRNADSDDEPLVRRRELRQKRSSSQMSPNPTQPVRRAKSPGSNKGGPQGLKRPGPACNYCHGKHLVCDRVRPECSRCNTIERTLSPECVYRKPPSHQSPVERPSTPSASPSEPPISRVMQAEKSIEPGPGSTSQRKNFVPAYYIMGIEGCRRCREPWKGSKLSETTLDGLFREVSDFLGGTNILRIHIRLRFLDGDLHDTKCTVHRGDPESFQRMREDFIDALEEGRLEGITRFKIIIDPVLEGQPDGSSRRTSNQVHAAGRASF